MTQYTGVVFCGGYGTRMFSHNSLLPKPLVPICRSTIIDIIIKIFQRNGIDQVLLLTGYKSIFFENKFISNKNVHVINTGVGIETGHRLFLASEFLNKGRFILTYGDSIVNFNLDSALKQISNNFGVATYEKIINYGVLSVKDFNHVNRLHEKDFKIKINAGYYILDNSFFKLFDNYVNKSFEKDFLPKLIDLGLLYSYNVNFWEPIDCGDDVILFNKKYLNEEIKPWE